MFVKHYAPGGNKVRKNYFKHKSNNEGQKVIDTFVLIGHH